ncbi:MAG: sugar phosphate nucleotidyltransferase [Candidatus Poseidoniaceae archaeon]|jgi:mannose-1-phosphate guanylyltransferase|nr:sugar phosphate nucleotidyltransferase [Candidatus Poseidoniaceae archaeon]
MQVVVLAGGVGSRLRPWTNTIPKPLLPMLDSTLLERVVEGIPKNLVDELIVAGGYKIEMIEQYFRNTEVDFEVTIVPEKEPLGTGGALGNCRDVISGRFACFNGDIVSSLDVGEMLNQHMKMGVKGSLALWEVEDPTRFGIVGIDSENVITRFKEKPRVDEVFSNLINAGSYILEDEIFDIMPKGKHSLERDVFPMMASDGLLGGFPFEGYFIDAGTPKSWMDAVRRCIEEKRFNNGTIQGDSWVEDGIISASSSMIKSGCEISGKVKSSTLLQGAKILDNAIVENCLIGEGVIVGKGSQLREVIVDHGVIVPEGHIQTGGVL